MERNDASIPWFSLILAAVFWVILLFLFNGELAKEETSAPAAVVGAETAVKVDWQGNGKALYTAQGCIGCHGAQGQGGVGKVLVGSALVLGKPAGLVGIIHKGKNLMPAYPQLSEQQVLEVTNYVRNSWTNKGGEFGAEVFAAAGAGENDKALKNRSRFVPKDLKLPEIFLGTFIMVLLVYGLMGLYSTWAEGEQLEPGIHRNKSTSFGMYAMLFSLAMVVFCSVGFVRAILESISLQGLTAEAPVINVPQEGVFAAGIFLFLSAVIMLYKKYFMDGEVLVEDAGGEFPW
ncbi:MAG: cytochrome c [Pseudopedobacter sp.]|nr:cytochrome c [Deinococcales bacterium]